ncbi:putative transcriptional regulator YdeE [Pedobacter sp. UYP30]|uniref:GyrI-like domain-containing protein n=1 Tax=Pedobacter sp. UYP30 TaxID=1756400 RepID=UPI003393DDD4
MKKVKIESFQVIGISIRTTNEDNQAAKDIPALWSKFMSEQVLKKIPNKVSDAIYCMYTDYEKDHTMPYTVILGCKVSTLDTLPDGLISKNIPEASYSSFIAKGNLQQNIVYNKWIEIWNTELPRLFSTDFEIYGEKAQNSNDAEVEILIAIN